MKKKILMLILIGIFLMAIMQSLVFAEVQYYTVINTNFTSGGVSMTNITRLHTWVWYQADGNDFIKAGNPFEFAVTYTIQNLSDWNRVYPTQTIDYCNFKIRHSILLTTSLGIFNNYTIVTETETMFYPYNASFFNLQKFVRLKDGESAFIDWDCHFNGTQVSQNIPVTTEFLSPTRECKACQYYEYAKIESNSETAQGIGEHTTSIFGYIKLLFSLNIEIITILFWVFMLGTLFATLGLIFMGFYWFYKVIEKFTR
jgi:hypothetical protein